MTSIFRLEEYAQLAASLCWLLLDLFFDPEYGGIMFLRSVGLSPVLEREASCKLF
jgi:hypothetical protein